MFGEEEATNWLLAVFIAILVWAVWVSYRRPPPAQAPPSPPPKRPAPPAPISGTVEGRLKRIQELSSPTLSRDPGAVFSVLAPEIVEIIRDYEAKVAKFSLDMEDWAQKLKEKK